MHKSILSEQETRFEDECQKSLEVSNHHFGAKHFRVRISKQSLTSCHQKETHFPATAPHTRQRLRKSERSKSPPSVSQDQEMNIDQYYVDFGGVHQKNNRGTDYCFLGSASTECSSGLNTDSTSRMHPVAGHLFQWSIPRELEKRDRLIKHCQRGEAVFYFHWLKWKEQRKEARAPSDSRLVAFDLLEPFILTCHDTRMARNAKMKKIGFYESILDHSRPLNVHHHEHFQVEIENLVHSLKRPCVLDIKIGTRLYADDAVPLKRRKLLEKASTSTSLEHGVRFTGMKCTTVDGVPFCYGRGTSKLITDIEGFATCIRKYLSCIGESRYPALVKQFLKYLTDLRTAVDNQELFSVYGSSLLFVYDAHPSFADVSSASLKMIDFAHVTYHTSNELSSSLQLSGCVDDDHQAASLKVIKTPPEVKDVGYLKGIDTLTTLFKDLAVGK